VRGLGLPRGPIPGSAGRASFKRLRTEAMDESPQRYKLIKDLEEMHHLVGQGMAYLRSVHGAPEPPRRLDLSACIQSLLFEPAVPTTRCAFYRYDRAAARSPHTPSPPARLS
jgi:hypothetical protein